MASSKSVKQLFVQYEKAFSALDFEKIGGFFADTFISAGPNGVIANNKAEYLKLSQKASEFYRSIGQQSAKILSLSESEISNEYSMVNVHWGVTFQKTVSRLIEFDVSYLIQKTEPPKIILFIAHQDEAKAMKELGLTEK